MQEYKNFRPTQFDGHISVEDRERWLVAPVARNRDSEALSRSNFECFAEALGEENEDSYEIHRFGHWGPGWFEIILINPNNSELVKKAEDMEASLENYPVLNEEHFCTLQYEEAGEVWQNCYNEKERADYIRENPDQFDFNSLAEIRECIRGDYFGGYASELLY